MPPCKAFLLTDGFMVTNAVRFSVLIPAPLHHSPPDSSHVTPPPTLPRLTDGNHGDLGNALLNAAYDVIKAAAKEGPGAGAHM
jgi:hypothetical protein